MKSPPSGHQIVFQTNHRRACMEARLVLDATGISAVAIHQNGTWILAVHADDVVDATEQLEAYRDENPSKSIPRVKASPVYSGAIAGVLVYAAIMIYVAVLNAKSTLGYSWPDAGRVDAAKVAAGQWWRCVTALTLHADVGHLASNLAFGAVFGLLAGRILGGGVAWLVILFAGALGNLMNAYVQEPTHLSLGASTSVFAALGMLVSHALRPRDTSEESLFKRWSPLIAGVVLLGLTGVGGERTDVAAHVTGFLAGMLLGWIACRLPDRWLASWKLQLLAAVTSVGGVFLAWIVALAAGE